MKIFRLHIFLLSILVLMSGCGQNSDGNEKIVFWSANNPYEIKFAGTLLEKWNAQSSDIKIHYQPVPEGQSSEEVILASVVGETTPDIYANMWQGDVEVYAEAGVLVALDTLDGFYDFIYSRCDSSVVEEVRSLDGHIYQIPWKINPIMMIYNESYISDYGIGQAPRTYSEFFEAGKKFQKDNNNDGYVDQWFGYSEVLVTWWQRFFDFYPLYLAATGGAPLVANNKAAFNNEQAVGVFKFLRQIYEEKYFPQERISAREDAFLSGTIASRFTGPWEITHAEKFKPEGFVYNFQTIPVPDSFEGPAYTYCDPKNIVIFNTCKQVGKAWEFLKFMCNPQSDLLFLETTNQLPRRKEMVSDSLFITYFNSNPMMVTFAEQAKHVRGTDQSPVLKEVFDLISIEYEACVIYGVKSPEQAIKDAADAVNLLLMD